MKKLYAKEAWTNEEIAFLSTFRDPGDIQKYLNSLSYNDIPICKSPRYVMRDKTAHCAEGAYLSAAILRYMGHRPLILDMLAENDDDHLIAIFKYDGYWGAVAKSNTTLLRFREPVYSTLRELVMSYFEFYFNTLGFKSLRSYSKPVNLARFDDIQWMTTNRDLDCIGKYLAKIAHLPLLPQQTCDSLEKADEDIVKACFLGANEKGLYVPKTNS